MALRLAIALAEAPTVVGTAAEAAEDAAAPLALSASRRRRPHDLSDLDFRSWKSGAGPGVGETEEGASRDRSLLVTGSRVSMRVSPLGRSSSPVTSRMAPRRLFALLARSETMVTSCPKTGP